MFDHPTTKAIATFASEQLASVVSEAQHDGNIKGLVFLFVKNQKKIAG